MIWDNDPRKNEKLFVMDSIIKFSLKFHGKDSSEISMKDLSDFIDEFFEKNF